MNPNRYIPGQSSALRKSRLEGKVSLLPKPRRPGSTDRLSTEARRPSTAGHRSSSAEPARGTFGAGRLSREASATKLPLNGRSRSQQADRFGQSSMTPLRSSHYAARPTTTPVRTPSEDRASRNWQTSLDRALAFVTIKDQRFQEPGHQFVDLDEEYLQNLKILLGNDEEKIAELNQIIKKYETCLEDEVEAAARADEARRAERREALLGGLRALKAARRANRADYDAQCTLKTDYVDAIKQLDTEIERATAESQQLKQELESQPLSVEQRTKLLDEVDYALRVQDSKRSLAEQIGKMVLTKETELALWQKKTLDSCVEYKQGLIHLSAQFPDLVSLAIDEKELMSAECAVRDETRAKIREMKTTVQREQDMLDSETSKEADDVAATAAELRELNARMEELKLQQEDWRSRLTALQEYIEAQRAESKRVLEAAREKRVKLVVNSIQQWNEKLAQ
ncbi:hypothetical protein HF086_011175 [Spodoptera exigua]|uniref:Uncharacterized protein n=1 Tax=Spodoptera exigua TaxID=7107 RepID=A0A922MTL3_SPOEX|nr:hypothetical protein HF086_011175 [Spodoptera exigua]